MFFANDTISLSAAEATPKAVNYLCWKSKMVGPKLRSWASATRGHVTRAAVGPGRLDQSSLTPASVQSDTAQSAAMGALEDAVAHMSLEKAQ